MKITALELTRALSTLRPDCVILIPCEETPEGFNTTDGMLLQVVRETPEHQIAIIAPTEGKWAGKRWKLPEA